MTRRRFREELFKLLFRVEFTELGDMPEQIELFMDEVEDMSSQEAVELRAKATSLLDKIDEIDAKLNDKVTGWDTGRIGKVELTVLRIAIYEIESDDSVPTKVAINEAVELCKKFGPESSASFVNGVLAKFTD